MNNRDEQLSAFLDSALNAEEHNDFLADLKQSPVADAEKNFRYKLIGDVMRDDVDVTSFMDISASVHRAIDAEETYGIADKNAVSATNKRFDFSSWLRPLSGMAVAASVALVTVVAFRTVETESIVPANQLAADARAQQEYIQATDITPVNANLAKQLRVVSVGAEQPNSALRTQQLNEYMMNHSGYAGQNTMQGMMPYVRVASYGSQAK
ncbi:MAG: sigma-E factor negative regulatory protein [Gammaproteobacteria bacterium]|nr:sigma-E factor negative regulatory protein [Gammaproteobacteria bacterium]MCW9004547.1 sigma-E factor negative regulatory protein [Gammaproteobacteria bacterium]